MIPYPPAVTWLLVAATAIAVAAPGRWIMLAIVPITAAAVAVATARPRPPRIRPPASPFRATGAVTVRLDIRVGSMDRDAEAAWRARYEIPPGLPLGGWDSGGCRTDQGGGWTRENMPWPSLPLADRQLEQLERLASTGELEVLKP